MRGSRRPCAKAGQTADLQVGATTREVCPAQPARRLRQAGFSILPESGYNYFMQHLAEIMIIIVKIGRPAAVGLTRRLTPLDLRALHVRYPAPGHY